MGLLELLEAGDVDSFNTQRGDRGRLDLFAADLPGRSLVGVDWSSANVDKADLTGTDLSDANLYKASLTGVDGTGMKLRGAIAVKVRLKEAWLDEADLSGGDLSRADLAEAVLTGSRGEAVRLTGARLREANARNVVWHDADLSEASFHKADFTGADLRRADLTEANGVEAILEGARLDSAVGTNVRLPAANLRGASLVGARLVEANLAGADLTGAKLQNADLSRANLTGAILAGADLRGVVLADACLDGCDLSGLDLTDADLSGVDAQTLGLSPAQIESASAVGVEADPEAPLHFSSLDTARNGDHVAIVWENPDDDTRSSLRFAVISPDGATHGLVPVPAESVLARCLSADADGFQVVAIRERPGGVVVQSWPLGRDGTLGGATTTPLGYTPGVRPVLRHSDEGILCMWGLARRGPTLVVHGQGDEGFKPIHSERIATARGFLGRHHPVLACKGGVVMSCGVQRAGKPLRTPAGFPGHLCTAVPLEDRLVAAWVENRGDTGPGGLRAAWLGGRGALQVETLSQVSGVTALDGQATGDTICIAWIEAGRSGLGQPVIKVSRLDDEDPVVVDVDAEADELSLAAGPGADPLLVLTTLDDEVIVCELAGRIVGRLAGGIPTG